MEYFFLSLICCFSLSGPKHIEEVFPSFEICWKKSRSPPVSLWAFSFQVSLSMEPLSLSFILSLFGRKGMKREREKRVVRWQRCSCSFFLCVHCARQVGHGRRREEAVHDDSHRLRAPIAKLLALRF